MTWLHRFTLDTPQPVAKHPGHGDQAVHSPRKGGGAGAVKQPKRFSIDNDVNDAVNDYASTISNPKAFAAANKSPEARSDVAREVAGQYARITISRHGFDRSGNEDDYDEIFSATNRWLDSV